MRIRLNGITFQELPYIEKYAEVIIVREEGELWDSDARPAYAVRLEGMHIGYIPLVETIKEEELKARDGFKKVWKEGYGDLTKEELREVARHLNEGGVMESFHDWEFVGKDEMKGKAQSKMQECEYIEMVRDWIRVEMERNHLTPTGQVIPLYYDEKHGVNSAEIGEICSISVNLDLDDCCASNPLGTQTSAAKLAQEAADNDWRE